MQANRTQAFLYGPIGQSESGGFSTAKNMTIGTAAMGGFYVGGPVGVLIGGIAGYITSTITGNLCYGAANYLRNGAGTLYFRTQQLISCAYTQSCQTIYYMTSTLPSWMLNQVEKTEWVQAANVLANTAYLQKCRESTRVGKSMDLASLFTVVPGGVSSKKPVIAALAAQAIADGQKVTKEQVNQWVALGERLIQALSNGKASKARDGAVIVKSPENGEEVYIESSVYNTRAIMWYFVAQAVWGELVKQEVLIGGEAKRTKADIQNIVSDVLAHRNFVYPDKHKKIFTFLSKAKTSYLDKAGTLAQDSALQRADKAACIDDTSLYLPGKARRTTINLLKPVGEGPRLAVSLEDFSNPSILGQRSEGHEPKQWHIAQAIRGVSDKIIAGVHNLAEPSPVLPKTHLQLLEHEIHTKMLEMLATVKAGDASWAANREQAFMAAKKLPLHELLPYLIHPEHAKVYDGTLAILNELSDIQRDELKVMVYRALLESVQAGGIHRRGHETLLMPYMTEEKVREYWNTQVANTEGELFPATFTTIERDAQLQERNESRFNWMWRKVVGDLAPTVIVQQRKTHEQALFQQAYLAILADAQTPDTIAELDVNALLQEAKDEKLDKIVEQFEQMDNTSTPLSESIDLEPTVRIMKPAAQRKELSSFRMEDYIDSIPEAIIAVPGAA